jgi:retron-type reverse transcriptase
MILQNKQRGKPSLNKGTKKPPSRPPLTKREDVTKRIREASGVITKLVNNKINVLTKLRTRVQKALDQKTSIPVFNNLMPIITSKEVLTLAYSEIKSNSGAMTPGTQNQTADEFSTTRLSNLQHHLKNGTYKFPELRRTWIPKPGKGNSKFWKKKDNLLQHGRPLSMPDFDAKIAQAAINLVLVNIYEPIFEAYGVSFGFRPNHDCHKAVSQIPSKTQGMQTAIEGDIKGAFNSLNHDKLIKILERRISDKKFLKLIYNCCKAGIFDELQNSSTDSLLGVPQGGIVSPTLWNIYMHEFDRFILNDVASTISILNKRQNRDHTINRNSPRYRAIIFQKKRHITKYQKYQKYTLIGGRFLNEAHKRVSLPLGPRKLKDLKPTQRAEAIWHKNQSRFYNMLLLKTESKSLHKSELRIYYIRYADDWILFHNGKPALSTLIRNKCTSFLRDYLNLTLALEKTKITNLTKTPALFLSFSIKVKSNRSRLIIPTKTGSLKRVTGQKAILGIDKVRLINRLTWKGFLDSKKRPREQPAWSTQSDYEIINRYNAIIRGTINYYAPIIRYRSSLNYFVYVYEYSCYKTLCQKHRTTIHKLIQKYGHPLTLTTPINGKPKTITLLTTKHYWPILEKTSEKIRLNLISQNPDPTLKADSDFLRYARAYWRTKFKLNSQCIICGSNQNIEMHHIKHVRGYEAKRQDGFIAIMNTLNRKQIPVCKHHHKCIHDGQYDSISLTELYDSRLAQPESYLQLPEAN